MMHVPHLLLAALQVTQDAAGPHAPHHVGWLKHVSDTTRHFFERFGAWGLAAIALLDSAVIPMPWQVLLVSEVHTHPATFLLYPLIAALASALGSLVPFYVGRLGGELFLLGKINRERYERLRDRFERQEFLAIFVPAMGPPPTPIKLFEFCAGVFEMKAGPFFLAIFLGKMVQFVVLAFITHFYGPGAMATVIATLHDHRSAVFLCAGFLLVIFAVWLVRKVFDRRRGTRLPIEDGLPVDDAGKTVIVEE